VPVVVKHVPPIAGFALVPTQTPLPVTLAPPSDVTFPPSVAPDEVIEVLVGVVIVEATAGVVNERTVP